MDHGWTLGRESVIAPLSESIFIMWYENKRTGIWPRPGGWLDQPLSILTQMKAIEIIVSAITYMQTKDSNWSQLSKLQADMIRWVGFNG